MLSKWVAPRFAGDETGTGPGAGQPPVAPLPAGAEATDGFPHIPGIDRERAAQRLSRDRAMFLSLLQMFVEDNADAAELTRCDLAAGERASAARRMHTLASNAGFLCALDLMKAARALEEAIDRGDTGLDGRLAALGRQIAALVEASAPWR
jgi:HPt (histidine-containing phosphotransfer) domain-containing protein